ncbi:AAA family ATPase [Pseudomonas viridiflava]|uniref:AAA family ATPase n=1 Tax=Pseudomonas viridiflava TaxID=33069 RepID=UPI000F04BEE5|nr:AAA family ATPase [Pseudomonas viridiflava]
MQPAIKFLSIRMLHHYLDIDLEFSEGLNVIYGKNGKGKTTVLHVIANILELDFSRFTHIKFQSITLVSFSGDTLSLYQESGAIHAMFNDFILGETSLVRYPILNSDEEDLIRKTFGGRPVYLPAYRSILEKVKSSSNTYDSARNPDYEGIKKKELAELTREGSSYIRHRDEQRASHVAFKTLQCRDWFVLLCLQ